MRLFDRGLEMLLDGNRRDRLMQDDTDFYIPELRRFSEIRRPEERLLAIDHDAFRMEAVAWNTALHHAAGIVKNTSGGLGPGHSGRKKRSANLRNSASARVVSPGAGRTSR